MALQHVLVHGLVPPQVQDSVILLVDLHEVPVSPFLQRDKVPLDGSTTLWRVSHFSQFGVINKLAAGTLCPIIDPWGTLLITGLQLDFVPLITNLWAWPCIQFSVLPRI